MHFDMEDLLEQANEIQETLGRSYAVPDEVDEADLQAGEFHVWDSGEYKSDHLHVVTYRTGCSGFGRTGGKHVLPYRS